MDSESSIIYKYQYVYCHFVIAKQKCKWWEFIKKQAMQTEMDYYYPLMKSEHCFLVVK